MSSSFVRLRLLTILTLSVHEEHLPTSAKSTGSQKYSSAPIYFAEILQMCLAFTLFTLSNWWHCLGAIQDPFDRIQFPSDGRIHSSSRFFVSSDILFWFHSFQCFHPANICLHSNETTEICLPLSVESGHFDRCTVEWWQPRHEYGAPSVEHVTCLIQNLKKNKPKRINFSCVFSGCSHNARTHGHKEA